MTFEEWWRDFGHDDGEKDSLAGRNTIMEAVKRFAEEAWDVATEVEKRRQKDYEESCRKRRLNCE